MTKFDQHTDTERVFQDEHSDKSQLANYEKFWAGSKQKVVSFIFLQ